MLKRLLPLLLLFCNTDIFGAETPSQSLEDTQTTAITSNSEGTDVVQSETSSEPTSTNQSVTSQPDDQAQEPEPNTPLQTENPALNWQQPAESSDNEEKETPPTDESTDSDNGEKSTQTESSDSEIDEDLIADILNEEVDVEQQETNIRLALDSELEFGYQSLRGNTNTDTLNARVGASYIYGRLRNTAEWKIYTKSEDDVEKKRTTSMQFQSDYKLGPQTYLYGNFKGIDSLYSAYFRDYTLSAGLGWQAVNTELFVLEVEAGPGYRIQKPNTDEIDSDDPIFPDDVKEGIFRSNVALKWMPLDTLTLGVEGTLVYGQSNTRVDTELSITNNVTKDIAIKMSHARQDLSRVPEGLSHSDAVFKVNLLFLFK